MYTAKTPVALAFAALSTAAFAARAECTREAADVSWVRLAGADVCPEAAQIRAEIARRLGAQIGAAGEGRSIEAVVEGGPGAWSARIHVRGCGAPEAVRALSSNAQTCTSLATAATLVIALAIDPEADLRPPAAPPVPIEKKAVSEAPRPEAPPCPRAPAIPHPRPAPPKPAPRAPQHVQTAVTLRGLVALGLLPQVGPGVAWAAEWKPNPLLVVSSGLSWWSEQRASDPTFAFGMTAGWMGACVDVLRFPPLSLGPCGRLLAGSIHAVLYSDPKVTPTEPGARAWAGVGAGMRLGLRILGPLRAEAGFDLVAPLTRHAFTLRNAPRPIFVQPPVTGALFLGAGVVFW